MGIPIRYNLSNFIQTLRNPKLFLKEAQRLAVQANATYSQLRGHEDWCAVVDEEWDNLIILDGCRYDLFEETSELDGRLESRISAGSESWEFLEKNFQGRQLHNTIYITANPHAPRIDNGTFYKKINLLESGWDPDLKTVTPEIITKKAVSMHQEYPHKRLIIHYMQPHFPFIGKKGKELEQSGVREGSANGDGTASNIWNQLRYDRVDVDEDFVYEAYKENLELTLPYVSQLLQSIDGKSAVTSDHGNLVGERAGPIPIKGYGHPEGYYTLPLVKVPWLVVEATQRREVTVGSPTEQTTMETEVVQNRLENLGYK